MQIQQRPFRWDVFISHNQKSKPWVRDTVATLRERGLRVFFDEDSIQPGEDILLAIENGLEQSQYIVLVLTPEALDSKWVALETSIGMIDDPDAKRRRIMPVLLEPIPQDKLRPFIRRLNCISLTDPDTYSREYGRLLQALGAIEGLATMPTQRKIVIEQPPLAKPRLDIPILSIMGTKGGAGKTTIIVAMAELIASTGRNVLIIDADIESAGVTKYLQSNARVRAPVWTVLDTAFARQEPRSYRNRGDMGAWDVTPKYLRDAQMGHIFLIPGRAERETRIAWDALANIHPDERKNEAAISILVELAERANAIGFPIAAVLIDCGAETNPLVSASIVLAESSYIVSGPHIEFSSAISDYERMHRLRYPYYEHRAMNVIVNQATEDSIGIWSRFSDIHFVMEDPEFRAHAAVGKIDFEGVGLNNLYAQVLKVLESTLASRWQELLPNPTDVWIKPYVRKMKSFPEKMLSWPRYSRLNITTALVFLISLVLMGAGGLFLNKGLSSRIRPLSIEIKRPDDVQLIEFTAALSQMKIPSELDASLTLSGTELLVTKELTSRDEELFENRVGYKPVVDAFKRAKRTLEEKKSVRLFEGGLMLIAGLGLAGFFIARFLTFRRHKDLLTKLIRMRDSGDEKGLSQWLQMLISEEAQRKKLIWLREAYRQWLAQDMLGTTGTADSIRNIFR